MKHQTVLITGVAGFIGSSIAARLLEKGIRVIGIDKASISSPTDQYTGISRNTRINLMLVRIRLAQLFANPLFEYLEQDLSKGIDVKNYPEITAVIHLAAKSGVRENDPDAYIQSNVQAFANVALYVATKQSPMIKTFLYASSSTVYGDYPTPWAEDLPYTQPKSGYGSTKVFNEMLANNLLGKGTWVARRGLKICAMRFFSVYGPYGRPDMAPWIFTDALYGGKTGILNQDGLWARDFTYIGDVTQCIKVLLEQDAPPPIINVGTGKMKTGRELVRALTSAIGDDAEPNNIEMSEHMSPFDTMYTAADTTLLRQVMQNHIFTGIDEGTQYFVNWYKQNKFHNFVQGTLYA